MQFHTILIFYFDVKTLQEQKWCTYIRVQSNLNQLQITTEANTSFYWTLKMSYNTYGKKQTKNTPHYIYNQKWK